MNSNNNTSIINLISAYKKKGFALTQLFDEDAFEDFILSLEDLVKMQMRKLNLEISDNFNDNILALNEKSSPALDEVLTMVRNTSEGHRLAANKKLNSISQSLLSEKSSKVNKTLIISGPSFFVNISDKNERKYTWHAEHIWYPKRRNFLNIWCPLITDRVNENSMAIMSSSHKQDWFYFSEYSGYDEKVDNNTNVQYEIPSSFLKSYEAEIPPVKLGEGLFFNSKLVHRSIENKSNEVLFAMVFRVFDYSEDLTLSSNWADLPYNRKSFGFPNINVNP
jgi:hypothetical protein